MLEALSRLAARVTGHPDDASDGASSPETSAAASPIGDHLTALSANVRRVSAIVNDVRTRNWLAAVFEDPSFSVALQPCGAQTWQIDVEAHEGRLRFNVGLADLPLALGSAAITPDRALACDVATLLLAPVLERLAPVVTEARVDAISRCNRPVLGFMYRMHGKRVALTGADTRLTTHAASLIGTTPINLSIWAPLRVAGRLRLMVRFWPRLFLSTLAAGDIVLLGPSPSRHTYIIGTGISMQAETEMDFDEGSLQVSGTPEISSDEVPVPQGASGRLEDLQLPVSFEIDTARVSLGELAAMQTDYVIELDVPLKEATVRLVCHGQTIGHGQLVAVGAQIGVRITRMGLAPVSTIGGHP